MDKYVIGFWGSFFGTAGLMLLGSLFAWFRSLRRVASNAAVAAMVSAFFVIAFLGWLPIDGEDKLARFLAHVASLTSAVLAYLLFSILGVLRHKQTRRRCIIVLGLLALGAITLGWWMQPLQALAIGTGLAGLLAMSALVFCMRSALRGDPLAWVAVIGVCCLLLALGGLSWIALDRAHVPWRVHVASALTGDAYLVAMALMTWARYSYLIELRRVMSYGPSYDPVTRMRSRTEIGQMVSDAFKRNRDDPAPLGVIVASIANLSVLEKLYGRAAANHALFVCAGRLRRIVPAHVEMGRLGHDGFLLLVRNCRDRGRLMQLARAVQSHLSRSVMLNTGIEVESAEPRQTYWEAEAGVGVLHVSPADARAAMAIDKGRGISRAALSYPSRIAWYDAARGEIIGMPVQIS